MNDLLLLYALLLEELLLLPLLLCNLLLLSSLRLRELLLAETGSWAGRCYTAGSGDLGCNLSLMSGELSLVLLKAWYRGRELLVHCRTPVVKSLLPPSGLLPGTGPAPEPLALRSVSAPEATQPGHVRHDRSGVGIYPVLELKPLGRTGIEPGEGAHSLRLAYGLPLAKVLELAARTVPVPSELFTLSYVVS